ncbi:MAG: hypothetical protein RLN88_16405 [Ekhidna sp.]|uniref:hypothetical protein n=1 Tax=Ekhidna sp. TaxID=2608089 RepID=UPI0032EC6D10
MTSGDWKGFIQAIIDNNRQEVEYYLSSEVDLNYAHPEMMTTPLIEAVRFDYFELVVLLLEKGASPTFQSQLGESPLKLAKQNQNNELIKLLKKFK